MQKYKALQQQGFFNRVDGGSGPVYTVDGAITAIISTAPTGAVNELTLCQSKKKFRPIFQFDG